jgi:hypothetical protein
MGGSTNDPSPSILAQVIVGLLSQGCWAPGGLPSSRRRCHNPPMRRSWWLPSLVALTLLGGCISINFGRAFPSPDLPAIVAGQTDKAALQRMFGEPYQVGMDSGDATWRWFYGRREGGIEITKDLTVRFNANGTVKSYSFTSNFPEDMQRLK